MMGSWAGGQVQSSLSLHLFQGLFQGVLCPQVQSHAWEEPTHLSWREGTHGGWGLGWQPLLSSCMHISSAGLLSLDFGAV